MNKKSIIFFCDKNSISCFAHLRVEICWVSYFSFHKTRASHLVAKKKPRLAPVPKLAPVPQSPRFWWSQNPATEKDSGWKKWWNDFEGF